MKIAFFGTFGSFDYFTIGGVESFTRRLAAGLIKEGHQADFVIYRAPAERQEKAPEGLRIHCFKRFVTAANFLKERYDQVVTIFIPMVDRLAYMKFRQRYRKRIFFHRVYFGWPELGLKRQMAYLDARLYPFNGRLFCVSPRLYHSVKRWSKHAVLLLPPVPKEYFLELHEKPNRDKILVTYIGRTESRKGIENVIGLFARLQKIPYLDLAIHGFHHPHCAEGRKWHLRLSQQEHFRYFYTPFEGYSHVKEDKLRLLLRETDILLLPYRQLSSTIDTPLLILEGMASLCAVVTQSFGDIPSLYGPSPFLLAGSDSVDKAVQQIQNAKSLLVEERQRIHKRNQKLVFEVKQITSLFIKSLLHQVRNVS